MIKKKMLLAAMVYLSVLSQAQDSTITLGFCLEKAEANHPLFSQYDLLASSSGLKIKNLNKNYLPEMNINGDVHYQSDVTEVPTVIASFAPEPLDKDQYRLSLDVSQLIYDGGLTKSHKTIESIDNEINRQQVGVSLYQLKEKVIAVYFNIIGLQESLELLELTRQNLLSRYKEVESGVKNGLLLSSNAEILKAELLKLDQKEIEIRASIASSYKILSLLTKEEIPAGTTLEWQSPAIESFAPGYDRLEYTLFSLQQQKAESLKKVATVKRMPKLWAYGQAGYGRPGYNMLLNDFDDYYMIGAKLTWNVWNWNKTKNEKTILDLNKEIIESNKNSFDQGLATELERKMAEIMKIEALIPKDREIADIRSGIVMTYSSRLQNGVITATEYITELHAETEAKLNLRIHEVQLARAKYEYLATAGKL
jgi:outer membrane protein TolC